MNTDFVVIGIDQSLNATGLSVVVAHSDRLEIEIISSETISTGKVGMVRLDGIVNHILNRAREHKPAFMCMEDVTRMASSASIIPLVELYACIKMAVWKSGRMLLIQNQSQMKKFNFQQGNKSKDSSYLLDVLDATGCRFSDDNQADAYMHARLGVFTRWLVTGVVALSDLKPKQQEVFCQPLLKAHKMTQGKFKKLSDAEKNRLAVEYWDTAYVT